MAPHQIRDSQSLEAALKASRFLLFKHSDRCGVSCHAFGEYAAFAADHPNVAHGWIDVRAERELARRVTSVTGVRHASPQALWMVEGIPAWSASHFDITRDSLASAVDR